MNAKVKKVFKAIVCGTVVLVTVPPLLLCLDMIGMREQAAGLRHALREQGYKTDLADFEITNDAAVQAREMALIVFDTNPNDIRGIEALDLMPQNANGAVSVLWQENPPMMTWTYVQYPLFLKQGMLDSACRVAIAYPIRLDVEAINGLGGLSTASLTHLCSALNVRVLVELHNGHPAEAWTNLLAATRLVTAWEPNATVGYHLSRSDFVTYDYATTWQALQYHHWPDADLARLQHEWESADLFASVPDTAAFDCAESLEDGRSWADQPPFNGLSYRELATMTYQEPSEGYWEIKRGFGQMWFRKHGVFVDEKSLLLEMTNRESQLRQAIRSPSWKEMSTMPGVNDSKPFQSEYDYAADGINFHRQTAQNVLVRIAPAEARRRLLIAAIALERYHGKYGRYPAALTSLAPEFLKTVPLDFMDGKPLRYYLTDDGHFVLYSVGLDCVDDGGKMQDLVGPGLPYGYAEFWYPKKNVDIVWPRPKTFAP